MKNLMNDLLANFNVASRVHCFQTLSTSSELFSLDISTLPIISKYLKFEEFMWINKVLILQKLTELPK